MHVAYWESIGWCAGRGLQRRHAGWKLPLPLIRKSMPLSHSQRNQEIKEYNHLKKKCNFEQLCVDEASGDVIAKL